MKLCSGLLLLALAAWAQVAKPAALATPTALAKPARLSASTIAELEKNFDARLMSMADVNEPVELMGDTRGLQLDGYGVVFTSEVSLVRTPSISPFQAQKEIPKALQARVHQRRVERLPVLKAAMKEMLRNIAAASAQLPAAQQMVLVVRLYYGAWEDTTGMPREVIIRGDRTNAVAGTVETEER